MCLSCRCCLLPRLDPNSMQSGGFFIFVLVNLFFFNRTLEKNIVWVIAHDLSTTIVSYTSPFSRDHLAEAPFLPIADSCSCKTTSASSSDCTPGSYRQIFFHWTQFEIGIPDIWNQPVPSDAAFLSPLLSFLLVPLCHVTELPSPLHLLHYHPDHHPNIKIKKVRETLLDTMIQPIGYVNQTLTNQREYL